jgi:hypothetical protein
MKNVKIQEFVQEGMMFMTDEQIRKLRIELSGYIILVLPCIR